MTQIKVWSAIVAIALLTSCASTKSPSTVASSNVPPADSTQAITPPQTPQRPLTVPPDRPDPATQQQIEQFLDRLVSQGFPRELQGIWIQAGNRLLASHQGTTPLPAASVTKIATTLAALKTLGAEHTFTTQIGITGPIQNGVVRGDLVVFSDGDPFFRWEEAIAVGNALAQQGIKRIAGNLVVNDRFYMNFCPNSFNPCTQTPGEFLKQGLNAELWPTEAAAQYQQLPAGTPRPQIAIEGTIQVAAALPANTQTLFRHSSPPIIEQVKLMNRYSNNMAAEAIASAVGGADAVEQAAIAATGIPENELQLINGSGYGEANQMSPRAAVSLFLALQETLQPLNLTVADVAAVVGRDAGVLDARSLPALSVVKSGSLDAVSTIAGALPTQTQGVVWLAVMNGGGSNLEGFRAEQDTLLTQFAKRWGAVSTAPPELKARN
jgi:serine-type D-Ala-D-Ala carboxypeptidase/endopeptidase (penicillin-binding protein 4)